MIEWTRAEQTLGVLLASNVAAAANRYIARIGATPSNAQLRAMSVRARRAIENLIGGLRADPGDPADHAEMCAVVETIAVATVDAVIGARHTPEPEELPN